jgi:hypothetical protein
VRAVTSHERREFGVPDCLEDDHATPDPVWRDLHDVYLACDPARSATRIEVMLGSVQCLLENADSCTIAKFREGLL